MTLSNVVDAYEKAFRSLHVEYSTLMGHVLTEACQQLAGSENWEIDRENLQDKLDKGQADLIIANSKLAKTDKELQRVKDELIEVSNRRDSLYEELLIERQDNKDKDLVIEDLRATKPTMEKVVMQKELERCRSALGTIQMELMGTKATLALKTTQAQQHQQDSLRPPEMASSRARYVIWRKRKQQQFITTSSAREWLPSTLSSDC